MTKPGPKQKPQRLSAQSEASHLAAKAPSHQSALSKQLAQLARTDRALQGGKTAATGNVRYKETLILASKRVAADTDLDDLYALARSGLEELIAFTGSDDSPFVPFRQSLFGESYRAKDRAHLTAQENQILDETIESYFIFLQPLILSSAAHKTMEYMIRRFRIHDMNLDAMMWSILMYHETDFFVRCLQLMKINGHSRWDFLSSAKRAALAPSRHVLVQHCLYDVMFLNDLFDFIQKGLKCGANMNAVIRFFGALCMEWTNQIKQLEVQHVRVLMPLLIQGVKSQSTELQLACFMIMTLVSSRVTFTLNALNKFIQAMVEFCLVENQSAAVMTLIYLNQTQPQWEWNKETFDSFMSWPVVALLQELKEQVDISRFITKLLNACNDPHLIMSLLPLIDLSSDLINTLTRKCLEGGVTEENVSLLQALRLLDSSIVDELIDTALNQTSVQDSQRLLISSVSKKWTLIKDDLPLFLALQSPDALTRLSALEKCLAWSCFNEDNEIMESVKQRVYDENISVALLATKVLNQWQCVNASFWNEFLMNSSVNETVCSQILDWIDIDLSLCLTLLWNWNKSSVLIEKLVSKCSFLAGLKVSDSMQEKVDFLVQHFHPLSIETWPANNALSKIVLFHWLLRNEKYNELFEFMKEQLAHENANSCSVSLEDLINSNVNEMITLSNYFASVLAQLLPLPTDWTLTARISLFHLILASHSDILFSRLNLHHFMGLFTSHYCVHLDESSLNCLKMLMKNNLKTISFIDCLPLFLSAIMEKSMLGVECLMMLNQCEITEKHFKLFLRHFPKDLILISKDPVQELIKYFYSFKYKETLGLWLLEKSSVLGKKILLKMMLLLRNYVSEWKYEIMKKVDCNEENITDRKLNFLKVESLAQAITLNQELFSVYFSVLSQGQNQLYANFIPTFFSSLSLSQQLELVLFLLQHQQEYESILIDLNLEACLEPLMKSLMNQSLLMIPLLQCFIQQNLKSSVLLPLLVDALNQFMEKEENEPYLIHLLLSCLLAQMESSTSSSLVLLSQSLSHWLQITGHPQTQDLLLEMILFMTKQSPQSLFNHLLPLFAFMRPVMQRDDEKRLQLLVRVIKSITPLMLDWKEMETEQESVLQSFITLWTSHAHLLPDHRRFLILQALVDSLNPEVYLSVVIQSLLNHSASAIASSLMKLFTIPIQLKALSELIDSNGVFVQHVLSSKSFIQQLTAFLKESEEEILQPYYLKMLTFLLEHNDQGDLMQVIQKLLSNSSLLTLCPPLLSEPRTAPHAMKTLLERCSFMSAEQKRDTAQRLLTETSLKTTLHALHSEWCLLLTGLMDEIEFEWIADWMSLLLSIPVESENLSVVRVQSLLVLTAVIRKWKMRSLPYLNETMKLLFHCDPMDATWQCIRVICENCSSFLSPFLERLLKLFSLNSTDSKAYGAAKESFLSLIEPRLLLPLLLSPQENESYYVLVRDWLNGAKRQVVGEHYLALFKYFLKCLTRSNTVHPHLLEAFTAFVLHLNAELFSPLFKKCIEWANQNLSSRVSLLLTLVVHWLRVMKQLFVPFSVDFIPMLKKWTEQEKDVAMVLEAWTLMARYDDATVQLVQKELALSLIDPWLKFMDQESLLVGQTFVAWMKALPVESYWKQVNQSLLNQASLSSMSCLTLIYQEMGESVLVWVPESIPYWSEALESEDERMVEATQKLIKQVESLLGESLQPYFK